jgi:large subunit ribosomal protein L18
MAHLTDPRILKRKRRVSSRILGTQERPRISVFRSNKSIYVQAIDDEKRITLAAFSSKNLKDSASTKKADMAKAVGIEMAKVMKDKKIGRAVFDRGRYGYQGRVKALAEGLREGGITI